MSKLRKFQREAKEAIIAAWDRGARCVMPVLSTGAGKTVLMGDIAATHDGHGCAIAHRSELVGQISIALAREGVRHDIVAPKNVLRTIVKAHMDEIGASFYDPRAKWKVVSVDTLLRRDLPATWLQQVTLCFQDEGHHVLRDNKWGKAFAMFPNARGLFPTATPERADGKGLGSHADGLVDELVIGPGMRDLINQGYLTDYRILAPTPKDFDMRGVDISPTTGDYNADQMRERVKANNRIIGDVVSCYIKHTPGQLGITFAVDIEHANGIAAAYNAAGIPAVVVHAGSTEGERRDAMARFRKRELLQLVNVDLFGEGVDVPALEVVSFVRPTASYGLYTQQFGRALRLNVTAEQNRMWDAYTVEQRLSILAQGPKPRATIIDHVGNVILHRGPPDWRQTPWTLDARNRRTKATDGIPLRACVNEECLQPYERMYPACPYCGCEPPVPAERSRPEHVDGDLTLYTPELLAQLFGERAKVDGPAAIPYNVQPVVVAAVKKRHAERQQAQRVLRETMALAMPPNVDERINNRRFFLTHGIDTLAAQALGSTEALDLRQKILNKMGAVSHGEQ